MKKNKRIHPLVLLILFTVIPSALILVAIKLFIQKSGISNFNKYYIIFALIFTIFEVFLFLILNKYQKKYYSNKNKLSFYTPETDKILYNNITNPLVACDLHGVIKWGNNAFHLICESANVKPRKFAEITGIGIDSVIDSMDSEETCIITIDGRNYKIEGMIAGDSSNRIIITTWYDITELQNIKQELIDNDSLIAYIYIDNLEDLSQYEKGLLTSATASVEKVLYKWASDINGVLINYERDRYILIYTAKHLNMFMENDFNILDKIREIRIGDDYLPVTLSIGTSNYGKNLEEKRTNSFNALKFALAKGGDQAIVKTEQFNYIYGGITRTTQKRSSIKSRTIARILSSKICKSSNVLIMGHRNPDYDSIGSCVGIARLCMNLGVKSNIVVDKESDTFRKAANSLSGISEYNSIFITKTQASSKIEDKTILIICDVNNSNQLEFSDLVKEISDIAYIDHHRQTDEFDKNPVISYIEPSASSASELVSEILEQIGENILKPQEANLMYAGIMLDTKNFVFNTGIRTFESARYLRNIGDPVDAQSLFKIDLSEIERENKFRIYDAYRNIVMITVNDYPDNDNEDIIVAAKVADKMLGIENIQASFAILKLSNSFRISGRSSGSINVEKILRRLNGGGHYNAAAAQINHEESLGTESIVKMLKDSIDVFLDTESESENIES